MPVPFRSLVILGFVCAFSSNLLATKRRRGEESDRPAKRQRQAVARPAPQSWDQFLAKANPKDWGNLTRHLILILVFEKNQNNDEDLLVIINKLVEFSSSYNKKNYYDPVDSETLSYFLWCLETRNFCSFDDFKAEFPASFRSLHAGHRAADID